MIATAPSGKAPAQLIPLLANYGTLVIVGAPADGSSLEVNTMHLISKYARIQGVTCGSAASNDKVTQWSAQAGIKAMVTEWPLEKAQEAVSAVVCAPARAPLTVCACAAVERHLERQAQVPQRHHLQVRANVVGCPPLYALVRMPRSNFYSCLPRLPDATRSAFQQGVL